MTNYVTALGVQSFSITIASGSTTGTATINAVGSGAFILWDGENPSVSNDPAEDFAYLALTNSTTITATRNTGTAGTVKIYGCIVDGDTANLIKSVQYGTVTIASATSGTAAISAVTNANAAVHLLGWSSSNATLSGINEYPLLSLSGTTVTATRPGSTGTLVVGFVVIEFQGSALNRSVQNVAATISTSVTSYTATISSVNMNNAFTIFAGHSIATATTNVATIKQRGALSAATTVTVSVNTAAAYAKNYNCSVVEFVPGLLNSSVQRGSTSLSSATSTTVNLSTINEAYAAAVWLGSTTTGTTAVLDRVEGAASLSTVVSGGAVYIENDVGYSLSSGGASISASNWNSALPGTTCSTTCSITTGDTVVVGIEIYQTNTHPATVTNVTDNKGQTYTHVSAADASYSGGIGGNTSIWYCQNSVSGVTSITATYSASCYTELDVYSAHGVPTTGSIIDATATLSNGSSTNFLTSQPITTTSSGDIIFSCFANDTAGIINSALFPYAAPTWVTAYNITLGAVTNEQAIAYVGTASTYCASTVAFKTTSTATLGSTAIATTTSTTAGTFLFVSVALTRQNAFPCSVSNITDNKGQTYTHVSAADASYSGGIGGATEIWYCQNSVAGVTSVTATFNTGCVCYIDVYEVSGLLASGNPVDTYGSVNNGAGGTTAVGPSLTTTGSNEFVAVVFANDAYAYSSMSSPFTIDMTSPGGFGAHAVNPSPVTNQAATLGAALSGYCSSAVAILAAGLTPISVVQITKNTSTGNLSGSWEVIEFPAFFVNTTLPWTPPVYPDFYPMKTIAVAY